MIVTCAIKGNKSALVRVRSAENVYLYVAIIARYGPR